jgi:hypothetical protein
MTHLIGDDDTTRRLRQYTAAGLTFETHVLDVPMYSDNQLLAARVEAQLGERARIRRELVAVIATWPGDLDALLDTIFAL